MQNSEADKDAAERAAALDRLDEARRQAHQDAAGYLTHHLLEDAYNDAGVLSLAKGEYLAGFQKQPDGSLIPIVGHATE